MFASGCLLGQKEASEERQTEEQVGEVRGQTLEEETRSCRRVTLVEKNVVVQHELASQGLFGLQGEVSKVKGNSLQLHREGLPPVVVDCTHVAVWHASMQAKTKLKVQHMTRAAKNEILTTWGLLQQGGELLEGLPATGKFNCSSAHLDCWWSFVQLSVLPAPLHPRVFWVSAELSNLCLHGLQGGEAEASEVAEARTSFLLKQHAAADLTLAPVWQEAHWSLLAAQKGSAGLQVR